MPGAAGVQPNIVLLRQQFRTLTSLCTSWPAGFGLACREDGSKYHLQPASLLAGTANMNANAHWARFLWLRCTQTCDCENVAPDDPQPAPVARPACVAEEEPEPASLPQGAASSRTTTRPVNQCPATPRDRLSFSRQPSCSDWYGYPILADCRQAVMSLHQYLLAHINHISREEFLNRLYFPDMWSAVGDFNGVEPQEIVFALANQFAYLTREYPAVQFIDLPLTITKGTHPIISPGWRGPCGMSEQSCRACGCSVQVHLARTQLCCYESYTILASDPVFAATQISMIMFSPDS